MEAALGKGCVSSHSRGRLCLRRRGIAACVRAPGVPVERGSAGRRGLKRRQLKNGGLLAKIPWSTVSAARRRSRERHSIVLQRITVFAPINAHTELLDSQRPRLAARFNVPQSPERGDESTGNLWHASECRAGRIPEILPRRGMQRRPANVIQKA